jgi:hypothetical protein
LVVRNGAGAAAAGHGDGDASAADAVEAPFIAGTRVQVSLPDYVETSVTDPPVTIILGGSFQVTDTAKNQGVVASTKTSPY